MYVRFPLQVAFAAANMEMEMDIGREGDERFGGDADPDPDAYRGLPIRSI